MMEIHEIALKMYGGCIIIIIFIFLFRQYKQKYKEIHLKKITSQG